MTQLTEHFSLEEMTFSQVAARRDIDNTPGPVELSNLHRMALTMEQVRTLLGKSIHVDSGYRSRFLNASVGGVSSSAHCKGLACDFVCPDFGTPYEVAEAIARVGIEFDQLIREYGWVHLGLSEGEPRRQTLTKRSSYSPYENGINK
jgi:zinc D-Ala-D-Ala carboxypeptidase